MAFSASNNIFVFPTTKREANNGLYNNRSARLLTEQNLVNIINKLIDKDSFIISKNFTGLNNDFILEFNILGYYIAVKGLKTIVESIHGNDSTAYSNKEVWANILINNIGDYKELYGIDDNGSYSGVEFSGTKLNNFSGSLKLLVYDGENWVIPRDSSIKFEMNSLPNPIDCGLIDNYGKEVQQ